ncbi:MAG TPA: hypothetical protein VNA23_08365, partial [Anaerolineales bacterium]|nr:hypothetical protein [Anaerolineales bacterium]
LQIQYVTVIANERSPASEAISLSFGRLLTCTAPNAQSPRSVAEWECGASVAKVRLAVTDY